MRKILLLTAFLLLVGLPTQAAIAFVQAQNNEVTAATAVTVTISTTSGNLLVFFATEGNNNTLTVTITDSASQTWTQVNGYFSSSSTVRSSVWYKANSAAITSATATWSGSLSTRVSGMIFEVSGADLNIMPLTRVLREPDQVAVAL